MAKDLEVNILETWNEFKKLTATEMNYAVKRALRKGATELKKRTQSNARAGIKTYNNHPDGPYENDNIIDAVMVTKLQDRYDEDLYLKVHVMGNGRPGSKTFRFRFLEKGTKKRYQTTQKGALLKKPRYIGQIKPRRYFSTARDNMDIESIYLTEINKAIDKINSQ